MLLRRSFIQPIDPCLEPGGTRDQYIGGKQRQYRQEKDDKIDEQNENGQQDALCICHGLAPVRGKSYIADG